MKYQVVIPKKVKKQLKKIDTRYRTKILYVLVKLPSDPTLGKPLNGELKHQRSFSVWPYRIVYEIRKIDIIILILAIKHRQGAYK